MMPCQSYLFSTLCFVLYLANTLHCQGDLQFKENTVIDRAGNQVVKGLVTFFGRSDMHQFRFIDQYNWIAWGLGGALWQRCSYCNCFRPEPFGAAAMFFFAFWQLLSVFACKLLPLCVSWAFFLVGTVHQRIGSLTVLQENLWKQSADPAGKLLRDILAFGWTKSNHVLWKEWLFVDPPNNLLFFEVWKISLQKPSIKLMHIALSKKVPEHGIWCIENLWMIVTLMRCHQKWWLSSVGESSPYRAVFFGHLVVGGVT